MTDAIETEPWFHGIVGYHDVGKLHALTNDEINTAKHFEGHHPEFLKWPDEFWENKAEGKPCRDAAKNAYHVQFLADAMEIAGEWLAPPLIVKTALDTWEPGGNVRDGNHRIRSVRYLYDQRKILIPEPRLFEVVLCELHTDHKFIAAQGSVAVVPKIEALLTEIVQVIQKDELPVWLTSPLTDLGDLSPLECIERGKFGDVLAVIGKR